MRFSHSPKPRYGISSDGQHYCCIVRQHLDFDVQWFEDNQALARILPPDADIVYALPHPHIWRKSLYLGEQFHHKDVFSHIIHILKQELPLPLSEVYFDYVIQPLPDRLRLTLFALRKTFQPTILREKMIWDCELHCTARALLYLHHQPLSDAESFVFPFHSQYFFFQKEGLYLGDETQCQGQRLSIETINFPENTLDKHLYLSALGACLWNG